MDINILILGANHTGEIARELIANKVVSRCFCTISEATDEDLFIDDRVEYCIVEEVEKYANYEALCDLNSIPALSKGIMESMLPYESTCIKLGMRRMDSSLIDYEDEKKNYYNALRYWNYIFDSRNINYFYYGCTPHYQSHYIIYALCLIKRIHLFVSFSTSIPGVMIYSDESIDRMGESIRDSYINQVAGLPVEECRLEGEVKAFYDRYTQETKVLVEDRKKQKFNERELKQAKKEFFGELTGLKVYLEPLYTRLRVLKWKLTGIRSPEWIKIHEDYFLWHQKTIRYFRLYRKLSLMSQEKYNLIAENHPNLNCKFIYFALQQTPEATSLPKAGVFSEQYNSVQLLARAADCCGVKVYVKEHIVQPFREKRFYEILRSIPNVSLISTKVSTFDLIEHCIAVSTQTGTCILEGVLKNKPALVTSSGYAWKGLPGLFEIMDENQGSEVIRKILDGYKVDSDEVIKYFYAIQISTMRFPLQNINVPGTGEYREWVDAQVSILTEQISKLEDKKDV